MCKLVVFAGPNGSGKSTLIKEYLLNNPEMLYICPDNIAIEFAHDLSQLQDQASRDIRAWEISNELRERAFILRQSFVWETVFSDSRRLKELEKAQLRGYEIEIIFISTSDCRINISRVEYRVSLGGHPVALEKIESRYRRTMRLLPYIISYARYARIYDNSGERPELVFVKRNNHYFRFCQCDHWAYLCLTKYYLQNGLIEQVASSILVDKIVVSYRHIPGKCLPDLE